ncbi:hypothetical protein C8J57DRAFT_1674970, partial [Mycena rebaudengoi]
WLLTFPCCSHQGQLLLSDYIKESPKASEILAELLDFVNWLNNHDKVRDIFDTRQQEESQKVIAYLLPNLTRWTTHLIAALRFQSLKVPICAAILNDRDAIVKAQVGAETNRRKREELENDVKERCESIESNAWWDQLQKIIPDLEHICYLTNVSQSDHVHLDQFLLALAGLFLHFHGFSSRSSASDRMLGKRMCKRIEKRFKELDKTVFILALVLNPFEMLTRFGDKANIDAFKLSTELTKLFKRIKSRPPKSPRTQEEQQVFEEKLRRRAQAVNTAFMQYLSGTGPFESWHDDDAHKTSYNELHPGRQPHSLLGIFLSNALTYELASFALLLPHLVANQAGLERWFSDFSNKKNKRRNRLRLVKMAQQSKVTRHIRQEQRTEGLLEERGARNNHSESQIKILRSLPRYADAILSDADDSDGEGGKTSVLVSRSAGWRKQVARWQQDMRDLDALSDEAVAPTTTRRAPRSWLPTTLAALFTGVSANPFTLTRQTRVISEESLYMELLAAEHSGEEPDAGAQEGSGDDYD